MKRFGQKFNRMSFIFVFCFLVGCTNTTDEAETSSTPVVDETPVESNATEMEKENIETPTPPAVTPPEPPADTSVQDLEKKRAVALAMDSQIYDIILDSEKITQLIQDAASLFSDGEGSILDLYDVSTTAKETQLDLLSALKDLDDDNASAYMDACSAYISNAKSVADNMIEFIDSEDIEYLSDAKQCLGNSESLILTVMLERSKYLESQGFTAEEVLDLFATQLDPKE